ncbi:Tip elongation aberrant protein Tea4 [Cytospora mali]|uniref:Tip elongation aberrant protein Tea4 n=1 Tax=Cytospora mali TaxID=578113 RepID=A0A194VMR7_CYTMA|nr:Tip elongation aberrant protein Tea4 [Valsa mali]
MTRPEIIRADSIDLQDRDNPSAKKHPARPSPLKTIQSASGTGTANVAPHQAETLREVAAEQAEEELRSPRVSWANGDSGDLQQYAEDLAASVTNSLYTQSRNNYQYGAGNMATHHEDDLDLVQNGGLVSRDGTEDGDLDGDEGDLDDDMMDKISSSPSIDDAELSAEPPPRHHHLLPGAWPDGLDEPDEQPGVNGAARDCGNDASQFETIPSREGSHGLSHNGQDHENGTKITEAEEDDVPWQDFKEEQTHSDEAIGMDDGVDDIEDLVIPYEGSTDEDDDDDFLLQSKDPRFVDSGWGGECLHDTEDIDFELVYALHTFIATVEGQANATKGDAMVLLDDSNSYWWLVRVVKDSSIGYLPAEHIETPTERLARLNKHRNIDLSATMLGDQADKAKNSIMTAVRRRKAKNVSFAAPTYVDYSDFDDYSTDEDEGAEAGLYTQQQQAQQQAATNKQTTEESADGDESALVAPLRPRAQQKSVQIVDPARSDAEGESSPTKGNRTSEEIFETNGVEGPKRRADGTVRDSFFKDDTVETKKITLTPNLLRDDGTVRASTDSDKGVRQRPSLDKMEKLERELREDPKKGKDKKEKEKKGGFRSLFSRKDKRSKSVDDDDVFGKRSIDMGAEAAERESEDVIDDHSSDKTSSPQRNQGKLQKQMPRVEPPATRKPATSPREGPNTVDLSSFLNENKLKNVSNVPPASMRIVEPEPQDVQDNAQKSWAPDASRSTSIDDYKQSASIPEPTRTQSLDENPAVSRMQIEDSDSDSGVDDYNATIRQMSASKPKPQEQPEQEKLLRPTLPGAFPDSFVSALSVQSDSTITEDKSAGAGAASGAASGDEADADVDAGAGAGAGTGAGAEVGERERLSESPIEVSPISPSGDKPPGLIGDTSSQEDHSSQVSSPSPELIDREEAGRTHHRNQDSITTSTSTTTVSTWNDTSLRAFFDSGSDIRDLLLVVYDKTDVEPVGPDHPVAGTLFKEQNAKLAEITTQLDNMLGDWLARKQRLRGSV